MKLFVYGFVIPATALLVAMQVDRVANFGLNHFIFSSLGL
jgi:hypothetical protein